MGNIGIEKILDPMGIFTKEDTPKLQQDTSVNALPQTPTEADPSVAAAAEEERRRRRAATGANSTLLTSNNALTGAGAAGKKNILGG